MVTFLALASAAAWTGGGTPASAFFAWAVSARRLPYNPTLGIKGASRKGTTKEAAQQAYVALVTKLLAQK